MSPQALYLFGKLAPSLNAVYLGVFGIRLSGQLDILRLMTRGLARGQEFMKDFPAEDGEGLGQALRGKRPGARREIAVRPGGCV